MLPYGVYSALSSDEALWAQVAAGGCVFFNGACAGSRIESKMPSRKRCQVCRLHRPGVPRTCWRCQRKFGIGCATHCSFNDTLCRPCAVYLVSEVLIEKVHGKPDLVPLIVQFL